MKISILMDKIISYLENPNNHLKMTKQKQAHKTNQTATTKGIWADEVLCGWERTRSAHEGQLHCSARQWATWKLKQEKYFICLCLKIPLFFKGLICMCGPPWVCMYNMCAGAHAGQQRALDVLELELQAVVGSLISSQRTKPRCSVKAETLLPSLFSL